jgi:hypothetical protein
LNDPEEKMRTMAMAWGACFAAALPLGCIAATDKSPDKFREPIPASSEVSLGVPGAASPGKTTQAANAPASAAPAYAKYYQFTRNVTDGVDMVTAWILGSVWFVVHLPPTTIDDHKATWGPGGDALSPVVWRLTVTEVADHEFDYELDGRPKAATSEAAFVAVLKGHGYGKAHPEHRNGSFSVDNDAARSLDPARNHDNGTAKVTYHLSSWPATIAVSLRPTLEPSWTDIGVAHKSDGSGQVDISAYGDVEDVKDKNLEDIVLHSRWAATGAGRADVQVSGGDMPQLVKASECWSTSFLQSYYTDNVGMQPTEGDASACVFTEAEF